PSRLLPGIRRVSHRHEESYQAAPNVGPLRPQFQRLPQVRKRPARPPLFEVDYGERTNRVGLGALGLQDVPVFNFGLVVRARLEIAVRSCEMPGLTAGPRTAGADQCQATDRKQGKNEAGVHREWRPG